MENIARYLLLSVCFFFYSNTTSAQKHQDREVFLQNVLFNGLVAGIGAAINHPKDQKWHSCFIRGFSHGALGGAVIYSGKKLNYLITTKENVGYAWVAKITHSIGTSIVENAAYNERFGTLWSFDFGPFRADYNLRKDAFRVRIIPTTVVSYLLCSRIGKFDLGTTLASGSVVFARKDTVLPSSNRTGMAYGRAFAYATEASSKYQVFAHENIHLFQYREYLVFNSWFKPLTQKLEGKKINTLFKKYVYPDMPYLILPYEIQGRYNDACYYNNWYEFEAERLSTNSYVSRCK